MHFETLEGNILSPMTKMPDCFVCWRCEYVCTSCTALLITNYTRRGKKLACVFVCACRHDGCVPLPSPLLWGYNYVAWMATCYSLCFFHAWFGLLGDQRPIGSHLFDACRSLCFTAGQSNMMSRSLFIALETPSKTGKCFPHRKFHFLKKKKNQFSLQ